MRLLFYFFFLFAFHFLIYPQTQELEINYNNSRFKIHVKKLHDNYYFSLSDFVDLLSIPHKRENKGNILEADFEKVKLLVTSGHPFIILKNKKDNYSKTFQLPVSTF